MRKGAGALFFGVLCFAPLAFGATEPWSWLLMEGAAAAALVLYAMACHREGGDWYRVPGLLPLLVFLGYLILQLLPLPAGLVACIAPSTHALYRDTLGIVALPAWLTLSLNTKATLSEFLRYGAYVAFYVLGVQLLADREVLRRTVRRVVYLGGGIACYMLLSFSTATTKIYWLREVGVVPTGPYLNHNHFANLMAMMLPLAVALFMHARPRLDYEKGLRAKIVVFFSHHRSRTHLFLGLSALLIGASIFLSLSRGGMTSAVLGLVLFFLILLRREQQEKRSGFLWGMLIAAAILCAVEWWLGWNPIFARFERLQTAERGFYELRFDYWQDTLSLIRDFWSTGVGFGAFADLYPAYRTIAGTLVLDHAHNDYLELLAEGGAVGFLLVAWFWAAFLRANLRTIRQRRDRYAIYLFWAAMAGVAAFLLHGFTDFSGHLGANGLYLSFLAGVAVAAAHTRMRPGGSPSNLPPATAWHSALRTAMAASILLGIALLFLAGVVVGQWRSAPLAGQPLDDGMAPAELARLQRLTDQAQLADPLEGDYRLAAGNLAALLYHNDAAWAHYWQAVRRNPANGLFLQQLAQATAVLGDAARADRLFQAALRHERGEPERYLTYAGWLWEQGRKEEGTVQMQRALSLAEGGGLDAAIAFMLAHRLTDQEIIAAMPPRMAPNQQLAEYFSAAGREERAAALFERSLDFAGLESPLRPSLFLKPYRFFQQRGEAQRALAVMRLAAQYLPDDATIALYGAEAYEKAGLSYRAVEEYERTLALDPASRPAQRALARLRDAGR
ncbi:MAG: O-antigen ligase family protein [Thermodesulfobacteriota bacterium]